MNELTQKAITVKERLMGSIERGEITQHSRWYFWVRTSAWVFAVVILFLLVVYFVSFILFSLQASGVLLLSPFKMFGVFWVLREIPWLLAVLCLCGIIGMLFVVRYMHIAYRVPVLYLFLIMISFVGVASLLISMTKTHTVLSQFASPNSSMSMIYDQYADPDRHNITVGLIEGTTSPALLTVRTRRGQSIHIQTSSTTQIMTQEGLKRGDEVLIFGKRSTSTIDASAIRKITKEEDGRLLHGYHDRQFLNNRLKNDRSDQFYFDNQEENQDLRRGGEIDKDEKKFLRAREHE